MNSFDVGTLSGLSYPVGAILALAAGVMLIAAIGMQAAEGHEPSAELAEDERTPADR